MDVLTFLVLTLDDLDAVGWIRVLTGELRQPAVRGRATGVEIWLVKSGENADLRSAVEARRDGAGSGGGDACRSRGGQEQEPRQDQCDSTIHLSLPSLPMPADASASTGSEIRIDALPH
jgi:hypothetical protein